jgi:hypothetical protein
MGGLGRLRKLWKPGGGLSLLMLCLKVCLECVCCWQWSELIWLSSLVIGERLITPSTIEYLVVKLRLSLPSLVKVEKKELDVEETKRSVWMNEEKDNQFLVNWQEVEDLEGDGIAGGWAHAPYWPEVSFVNHILIFL